MTRRATAVLEVQVQDTQLDRHVEKLEAVRSAWTSLGGDIADLTASFSKGTGDELAKVSKAIAAMANVKTGGGAAAVVKALAESKPHLAGLGEELEKVSIVTNKLSNDSVRWARALTKAAAEVGRLEQRTDSLISSQERTTEHMKQFEDHLDKTTTKLKTQGKELLDLIQAYAGFNKAAKDSGGGGGRGGSTEKEGTIKGFLGTMADFERSFIRHATTLFIAGQWFKQAAESFRDAAAQIDLENVLGRSVEDFGSLLERTRTATRGMVSDLQIMKSAALMSSFKIPMENFATNMELVQKMAVRTGQDTTYMFDSLARGVSRLSPAILDNLGIQIKLKEAYEAGAAARGVGLDQMDKEAQKLAVLNEVTRQMTEATLEVDPSSSLQARIDQMEAAYENFTQKLKGGVLQAILLIAATEEERLAVTTDRLKLLIKEQEKYGRAVSDSAKGIVVAINGLDQKSLDMALQFVQLNPFSLMQATSQGMTVNQMLIKQGEAQGLIYNTLGKTVEQNKIQAKQEEERLAKIRQEEKVAKILASTEQMRTLYLAQAVYWEDRRAKMQRLGTTPERDAQYGERVNNPLSNLLGTEKMRIELVALTEMFDNFQERQRTLATGTDSIFSAAYMTEATSRANKLRVEFDAMVADPSKYLALPNGLELFMSRLQQIETESARIADQNTEKYRIRHAAELAVVQTLDSGVKFREQELSLLQGSTLQMIDFERAQKAVQEAQQEYNKLRENSAALAEGESSVANNTLETAAEKLRLLQQEFSLKVQAKEVESLFQKYLDAGKFGAKELVDLEFQRLSGGRSRLQIEAELVNKGKELLGIEMQRREVNKDITESSFMALAVDAIKTERDIARLQKLLDSVKMNSGGGRREGKDKDLSNTDFNGKDLKDEVTRHYDDMIEIVSLKGDRYVTIVRKFAYDAVKGLIASSEIVSEQTVKKFTGGQGLLGAWLGTENIDEKIANNEKIIESVNEMAKKNKTLAPDMLNLKTEAERANTALKAHRDILLEIADATGKWSDANAWAWSSAKGLIGDDFIAGFTGLGTAIKDVSEKIQSALSGEANGYDVLLAGMGGIRAFSDAFIKDRRKRAGIEALMNGAAAFAAAGYGNWPAAAAHTQAAIMYGLVAGGAVRLPSESRKDSKDANDAGNNKGGDMHFHLYADMVNTEAEKGQLLDRLFSEARAQGR